MFEQAQLQQWLALQSRSALRLQYTLRPAEAAASTPQLCRNAQEEPDTAPPPCAHGVPPAGQPPSLPQLLQLHPAPLRFCSRKPP